MERINSFKSFTEVRAQKQTLKLREENQQKRAQLSTRVAELLDEMDVTSFEEMSEETRTQFITALMGEGNAFGAAVKKAKEEGEDEFEVDGETYKVEESEEAVEDTMISEAVIVTGKRDAKKVFNRYVKFFEAYPALGRNALGVPSIHHIGAVKLLYKGAMHDANFHREADSTANIMKGRLFAVEVKVSELNNATVKVSGARLQSMIEDHVSAISSAAGFSGLAIAEGTALYLDSIKKTKEAEDLLAMFNQAMGFNEAVEVKLTEEEISLKESKISEEAAKLEERNAFLGARAKAIEEDLEEFEFNGKTYPVTVNESMVLNEGTRGQVGIIDKKGNITSIYTHYDSYPEWVLPIIKKHYKNAKAVNNLVAKGNSSGLDAIDKMNFYNDGTATMSGSTKDIKSYIKDAELDGGAEYVYLYDEATKKWMMADTYNDKDLKPAFESVVNEAEVTSDEEFKEYAFSVLKKAFGEEFDEAKAEEVVNGILDKCGDDYGACVGTLTSSLGESVVTEKYNKKSLMKAMKKDDGNILVNGNEYIIYKYDNGNDENDAMWGNDSIMALDQDGEEHEIKYADIERYSESVEVTEANSDGTISDDEDELVDSLKSDVEFMTKELINHIQTETEKIGGSFRAPGYEYEMKKVMKQIMQKKKFKL